MAWNDLIVDLNQGQAGVDLSLMAPYVAGVLVRTFTANLEDYQKPVYDTEAANHIQKAAIAGIPSIGIAVNMNASMWGSGGVQADIDKDVKKGSRALNPMYVAVKNFLTPQKQVQYIVLILGASTETPAWNMADMQGMIRCLEEGMKAKEIQKLKIMVATTPGFVKNNMFDKSQNINLFETFFYKDNPASPSPYGLMVQDPANVIGTYTWKSLQAAPQMTKSKPSGYIGGYPNPMMWQWMLSGSYMPYTAAGNRQFGVSSLWNGKASFFKWLGVIDTTLPPVVVTPPVVVEPPVENPPDKPPVVEPTTLEGKVDLLLTQVAYLQEEMDKLSWLAR